MKKDWSLGLTEGKTSKLSEVVIMYDLTNFLMSNGFTFPYP